MLRIHSRHQIFYWQKENKKKKKQRRFCRDCVYLAIIYSCNIKSHLPHIINVFTDSIFYKTKHSNIIKNYVFINKTQALRKTKYERTKILTKRKKKKEKGLNKIKKNGNGKAKK